MNVLFICSRNRLRSPTAEELFSAYPGIETASAGTNPDAENLVSADLVEWADLIFAMEAVHKRRLNAKFGPLLKTRRIVVLSIPDKYDYMDEALVTLLKQKVSSYL
ncbi:low molecular weight protein tyrosine phosphatase family protein [Silvibacterium dinghuense]|uniref:Phosphotyrosine protein phosphatase n=1 Tax=Silvibacterium dinghuense TaxID=1560006 RepID=A0A4Q1SI78_9BACT|nr:phosphotyrosine protein phosphatase [Silvibacterium dinghuense]RXS97079.1 phosphotyrosine protein phosphatase [Silvibacterium dinghuense]GGG96028.1 protein-tyrosine-phosphatase [Silvibacterium dinghuense]